MIRLTETRRIALYKLVHPEEEVSRERELMYPAVADLCGVIAGSVGYLCTTAATIRSKALDICGSGMEDDAAPT
jgi:hypothetical protein